eukprot:SM000387S14694  [mRNA]  locus=s387:8224:11880:- [translate_table: standard]
MSTMLRWLAALLGFLLVVTWVVQLAAAEGATASIADGTEEWGYTKVRPGAHMFWWLYKRQPTEGNLSGSSSSGSGKDAGTGKTPVILWLQGGPGASGVGYGNFIEIGPLRIDLSPRPATWLSAAHLLFVDNPVGVGYSYVEPKEPLSTTNAAVVADLIVLLQDVLGNAMGGCMQASPFFIFAESYGGKFAVELGEMLARDYSLAVNLQGVALGDSWISPIDFMPWLLFVHGYRPQRSWSPMLRTLSLVDDNEADVIASFATAAEDAISRSELQNATLIWAAQEGKVDELTDHVDFYNILRHNTESASEQKVAAGPSPGVASTTQQSLRYLAKRRLQSWESEELAALMNGPVRKKLGIIPPNLTWGESSYAVFEALSADFMLSVADKVDSILQLGVNVTIYSGQLDLICCTLGTDSWLQRLSWEGLQAFNAAPRAPLYCRKGSTQAFAKRFRNLAFYWVMNAGHMVPVDNPCMALRMVRLITGGLQGDISSQ